MSEAGWRQDPQRRHELRYWDGTRWTEHVSDRGQMSVDPLVAAPPQQARPQQAQPQQAQPQQAQPQQAQPQQARHAQPEQARPEQGTQGQGPQGQPSQDRPTGGGLTGDLVDGTYREVSGTGPQVQNTRMLRVRIDQPFLAKQGAMVGYQGNVDFAYQGGGAGRFIKKALTGEGLSLMQVSGSGDVFLADEAKHVHIIEITNSGLSVSGHSVLAFSASLDWNVERVKGGSMAAGGLFNTTLRGTGWVAVTSDGEPVALDAGEAPTFADAQALVAWSTDLQTSVKTSFTAGSLVGRGSGEAFQVAFTGRGFVIIQPSEGRQVAQQGQS